MQAAFGISALALAFAGCSAKEALPPIATSAPQRPIAAAAAAALSPAAYLALAGSSALVALRASQMAETRAADPRLRSFAATSVVEQRGIASQLSFAGRRVNLLPAAALLPQHQLLLDELAASPDFDATYRQQQRAILARAEAAHRGFAARGQSPTLRPVATMAGEVLRRHLEALGRL